MIFETCWLWLVSSVKDSVGRLSAGRDNLQFSSRSSSSRMSLRISASEFLIECGE